MIIPEMLAAGGLIPQTSDEVAWFKTGVIPPAGNYGRFWCDPYALFFIEVIAFQFAELRRWQDYKKPGSMGKQYFLGLEKVLGGSGNPSYPGTLLVPSHQCTSCCCCKTFFADYVGVDVSSSEFFSGASGQRRGRWLV